MNYTQPEVYEYISKQTGDPIVERKVCEVSGTKFAITQKDLEFYEKISPVFGGKKYQIPTPRLCPEERQRRRLLFRNERKLYRRKCDATGKEIIGMYPTDTPYTIYSPDTWWSDSWDAKQYSIASLNSKSIMDIIEELNNVVPKVSIINDKVSENSSYVNQTTYLKNCYLVFDADHCEGCLYSSAIKHSVSLVSTSGRKPLDFSRRLQ